MAGVLYIVATPIGNLKDISARALETLAAVAHIAAEDTRHSGRLLAHFDIDTPMLSLHEHNEPQRIGLLTRLLDEGKDIALITDAGTPAVSDPGALLVRTLRTRGYTVSPIPGPSAPIAALSAAGLADGRFVFEGFLPVKGNARRERLKVLMTETRPVVLFEAPHRLHRTLDDLLSALGEREITICRELTKLHEQIVTLPLCEAKAAFKTPRGEFVLIFSGAEPVRQTIDEPAARAAFAALLDKGKRRKDAAQQISDEYGIAKNTVYGWRLTDD